MGSYITEQLLAADHSVRVFEKPGASLGNIAHLLERIELAQGDFRDEQTMDRIIEGIDLVFLLIGSTLPHASNADPAQDITSNLLPTIAFLDRCRKKQVRRILFPSSGGTIYGIPRALPITEDDPTNPICSYGIQKLATEKYLELHRYLYDLDYVALRISNPYGDRQRSDLGQGVIAAFARKALDHRPLEIWGDGTAIRDYVHVHDVARAFVLAASFERLPHRVFNVGGGAGHDLFAVIREIENALGRTLERRFLVARTSDVPANVLSIERAQKVLGWHPTIGFSEGIAATVDAYRSRH